MSKRLPSIVETSAPLRAKFEVMPLTERVHASRGRMRVRGPSQLIGEKNENNRIYPRSVWEKNLSENSPFSKKMRERRALGELEHPESGSTRLHHVSHLVEKAWIEELGSENKYDVAPGHYVMTECLILNTPHGNILKELFEVDVPVGISSRGRGNTVASNGADIVQDDYELTVWDFVESPSVRGAHQRPVTEQEEAPPPPVDTTVVEPPTVPPTGDVPPPETPPVDDQKKKVAKDVMVRAEETIRKMEDIVTDPEESGIEEIAETFSQAVDILDQLGSTEDPEYSKIRGQLLTLIHVLAKVLGVVYGEGKESKESGEGGESGEKLSKSKESAEESITEEEGQKDMDDLAATVVKKRERSTGTVFRGELENMLNVHGHEPDEEKMRLLSDALRKRGFDVKPYTYGSFPSKQESNKRSSVVKTSVDDVLVALAEQNAKMKAELKKNEGAVTRERYDALSTLCKKLVERVKAAEEKQKKVEARYKAAVELVDGLVSRTKRDRVAAFVSESLHAHPHLEPIKEVLLECKDVDSAQSMVKKLAKIGRSTKRPRDGALPNLTEDTKKRADLSEQSKRSSSGTLIGAIARRFGEG